MAYYTNQVPHDLRPKHAGSLSRDKLFTPLEARRRLLLQQGQDAVQGGMGPRSRQVERRAGRVVEEVPPTVKTFPTSLVTYTL